MFRTDHCYPPTVRAPLDESPVFDFHFEAITMPAPLPPAVEPLAPSPRHTNNPPVPEVTFTDDEAEALWARTQEARRRWGASVTRQAQPAQKARNAALRSALDAKPQPPRRVSWFACAVGAVLFLVGFCVGRMLP